jgi:uncharacterized membrane protein YqjE
MVDQASMRSAAPLNGHRDSNTVVGNIAELGNDVATLVELQAKLAAADMKECAAKAVTPVASLGVAAILAVAAVPVALLGLADLLSWAVSMPPGAAKLIVAVLAFTAAALIVFAVRASAQASLDPLRRSREELLRNLAWVRTVLLYSGRSVPKRRL